MRPLTRRFIVGLAAFAMLAGACGSDDDGSTATGGGGGSSATTAASGGGDTPSDVEVINVGLLAPMTGPYAEHGELMRMGAELAIDEINEAGGIQSLGGAQVNLVIEDAGDSVESATTAAQRLFARDDLTAAFCCWLSSFTLAATEISERAGVPVLTFSFADGITDRGYSYIFREDAPAGRHVASAIPLLQGIYDDAGRELRTAALIGDNTAASTAYFDALREQLPQYDIEIIIDEVWTPPLPDANALARQVGQAAPDVIFNGATTFADVETLQRALNGAGVDILQLGNGGQFVSPAFYESVGDEGVRFVLSLVGSGVLAGMEELADEFEERFGTFMVQDSSSVYTEVHILAAALEAAGSTDRDAVRDAIAALEFDNGEGPAKYIPGGALRYDETGQNTEAIVAIQAWVNGRPVTIAPTEQAVAEIEFPE